MKISRWSSLAALLSFAALPVLAQQPAAAPAAAPAPAAPTAPPAPLLWQIVEVTGTVQIKADAGATWSNAHPNQTLTAGASVRTGADGKATLKAGDAAGVNVQPGATIEVGALSQSGDTVKMDSKTISGKALFLVNKLKTQDSSFKVETPTAIVGVRGTAFSVSVAEDGESSRVACFTGEVSVKGRGPEPGEVLVKEKMGTSVVKNKPPAPPEVLSEAEAAEWERMKSEIQLSTPLASLAPAIGGMIEMHKLQNAEADRILNEANRAIKGNKKADQDFKVFEAALVQYFRDTSAVPTKEEGLDALMKDTKAPGWKGPYLAKESNLLDPYGRAYKWLVKKSPAGKDIYEVRSGGPDGIVGNDDDHVKQLNRSRIEKMAKEEKPVSADAKPATP
jgi:ferric-dicitrate binding protein FerR (iron transport regulator)